MTPPPAPSAPPDPPGADDAPSSARRSSVPGRASDAEIVAAASALRRGELVAFPTETVYGLGADAADPEAVAAVFAAKGRPADHPLIVHLAGPDQLDDWAVDVPEVARRLAARFWPGPLTLILRRHPRVPTAVTGGQDTIGLRVPRHPVAHALLQAFGGGVAAPSANRFGRVSPTTRAQVVAELGDVVGTILEGGDCEVGLESTIVDLSGERPRLLRPGAIGAAELAEVLDAAPTRAGTGAPRTPGRLPSHYAPTTPVRVVDRDALDDAVDRLLRAGRRVVVLGPGGSGERGGHDERGGPGGAVGASGPVVLDLPDEPVAYGRALYRRLAEVDRLGCDVALVARPPARAGWEAVHDRLGRSEGVDPHTPRALLVVGPDLDLDHELDRGAALGVGTDPDTVTRAARTVLAGTGAILLGAWAVAGASGASGARRAAGPSADAGPTAVPTTLPAVLPGVRGERPVHLGPVLATGPGWSLVQLDASDDNLGIPVGRVELALALHATGPGTYHAADDGADPDAGSDVGDTPSGPDARLVAAAVLAADTRALEDRGVVVGAALARG